MNIKEKHETSKRVSAQPLFKGDKGITIAIQLGRNGVLEEHITKTPAILICVNGFVRYADENDLEVNLESGDFIEITPYIKHWVSSLEGAQLVLIK
jgi:quercetin dioxygenase-like cupin family protein